jgi:hypothetical protein
VLVDAVRTRWHWMFKFGIRTLRHRANCRMPALCHVQASPQCHDGFPILRRQRVYLRLRHGHDLLEQLRLRLRIEARRRCRGRWLHDLLLRRISSLLRHRRLVRVWRGRWRVPVVVGRRWWVRLVHGRGGSAQSWRKHALQNGRIDNLHQDHGLEEGVREGRMRIEQVPRLLR